MNNQLENLFKFQDFSKDNKNFKVLLNKGLARRLYELELTEKDINNLKKSFSETGKLKKDPNFYNLKRKRVDYKTHVYYYGLLLDCRYDESSLNLRWLDMENLHLSDTNVLSENSVIYNSNNVKKDEQAKTLKSLFMIYLDFVSYFL